MTPEQFHTKAQRAAEWWCEHIGTAWHDSFYKWMVREHGHVVGNDIAITDRMMIAMAEDRDWQDTEPADEVEWETTVEKARINGVSITVWHRVGFHAWACRRLWGDEILRESDPNNPPKSAAEARAQAIAAAKGLGEKG